MLKKIVVGVALLGLSGALVAGAINRTADRTVASAGSARRAVAEDAEAPAYRGQGYNRSRGQEGETGGAGEGGQAVAGGAWIELAGRAEQVGGDALVVTLADGGLLSVEGRAWTFAQEQGFSCLAGDPLLLRGFYEGESFEVGHLENLSRGQAVALREEGGRPLWAGRGWQGGL